MITGEKVILRPLQYADWEQTIIWRNNQDIKNLAMMHPFPVTEFLEKDWFETLLKSKSDKLIYFAIEKKDEHKLIGYVFLNQISYVHQNCYLGIIIGDELAAGKGFGYEAMMLILNFAFKTLNLHKVILEVVSFNQPAISLYKKIGFQVEGTLKNQFFSDDQFHDVIIMSVFKKV